MCRVPSAANELPPIPTRTFPLSAAGVRNVRLGPGDGRRHTTDLRRRVDGDEPASASGDGRGQVVATCPTIPLWQRGLIFISGTFASSRCGAISPSWK